jgi:ribosomal protein L11 methyltransferase
VRPDTPLKIFELRLDQDGLKDELERSDPRTILGPGLLGWHFEAGFAFLFCLETVEPEGLLKKFPKLKLQQTHNLRYDEWQDGARARAFAVGPLSILPAGGEGAEEARGASNPKPEAAEGGVRPVHIDPGLAFGFGGHGTTRACLSFLARIYSPQNKFHPASCLDLGTGTGVLALAAARLGASRVLGVDYSRLAVDAAERNLMLNRLEDKVAFVYGQAGDYAGYEGELLLANVPLAVHLELIWKGAFEKRRYAVVSGLLQREAEELKEKLFLARPFKVLDSCRDDRWSSWLLDFREF